MLWLSQKVNFLSNIGRIWLIPRYRINRNIVSHYKAIVLNIFCISVSNLHMTPGKAIAKAEKENKYKFPQTCLERRHYFTPLLFYAYGISGEEARAATQRMASCPSLKMKQEYDGMCGFVRDGMELATVRSNTILLWVTRDKDMCIRECPEFTDGSLMALLMPWRG